MSMSEIVNERINKQKNNRKAQAVDNGVYQITAYLRQLMEESQHIWSEGYDDWLWQNTDYNSDIIVNL